jgi:predicted alpha/beta-hydrolase family hydrolase
MDEQIPLTFPSGTGEAEIQAVWHPPTSRATNGAVIVLPGGGYTKDHWLNVDLCVGAAALGLTAVRLDFRYKTTGDRANFNPQIQGLDDVVGAYNFLQNFGREIKPKRLYLIGKSLGGVAALSFALSANYSYAVSGLGILGMVLHGAESSDRYWPEGLSDLKSRLLIVQGQHDQYASPDELQEFCNNLPIPSQIEIIKETGHSYEPIPPLDDAQALAESQRQNVGRVVQITLDWLEKQDSIREELRK